MADQDYMRGGLRRKYEIQKADGSDFDDEAAYFVLRLDEDPHARAAALAYAESVFAENPVLARELRAWVADPKPLAEVVAPTVKEWMEGQEFVAIITSADGEAFSARFEWKKQGGTTQERLAMTSLRGKGASAHDAFLNLLERLIEIRRWDDLRTHPQITPPLGAQASQEALRSVIPARFRNDHEPPCSECGEPADSPDGHGECRDWEGMGVLIPPGSPPEGEGKCPPHRWSGWPGAFCLDCGVEDPHEVALALESDVAHLVALLKRAFEHIRDVETPWRAEEVALLNDMDRALRRSGVDLEGTPPPEPALRPGGLTLPEDVTRWLAHGERGISSETMVTHFEGLPEKLLNRWAPSPPSDPSDFKRCVGLLEAVPRYRARLGELRELGPAWARLVDVWYDVEQLLEEHAQGRASAVHDAYTLIRKAASSDDY